MGLVEILLELFVVLLDVGTLTADIYAWFKGRKNRLERREAQRRGDAPPARDKWYWWVLALTTAFILLTAFILNRVIS